MEEEGEEVQVYQVKEMDYLHLMEVVGVEVVLFILMEYKHKNHNLKLEYQLQLY